MSVVIVYDSVFGNTEKIAEFIAEVFRQKHEVHLLHVSELNADVMKNAELFIAGSPTRAFAPTKNMVKALKNLKTNDQKHLYGAVFDTRMDIQNSNIRILKFLEKRKGYAADTMEKILKEKGIPFICGHEGFFVTESEGPLMEGETQRAKTWAGKIEAEMCKNEFIE
ncbi:MAG: flavodoxin domain-containing protein [Eubacteriales bacterium]|nr:flavodoxin domain-containing protein [Eubacteriales bacterium]HPF18845.1 flavodoxin domain-containing protein [Bacillota bacterium]